MTEQEIEEILITMENEYREAVKQYEGNDEASNTLRSIHAIEYECRADSND